MKRLKKFWNDHSEEVLFGIIVGVVSLAVLEVNKNSKLRAANGRLFDAFNGCRDQHTSLFELVQESIKNGTQIELGQQNSEPVLVFPPRRLDNGGHA